jgi:thiamine pyrophosphate-dependent acetolactate synthase large subunit-like protein
MQGCDTLLMVGTGFPWSEFLPKDGAARAVQIDIEASMLSLRTVSLGKLGKQKGEKRLQGTGKR